MVTQENIEIIIVQTVIAIILFLKNMIVTKMILVDQKVMAAQAQFVLALVVLALVRMKRIMILPAILLAVPRINVQ